MTTPLAEPTLADRQIRTDATRLPRTTLLVADARDLLGRWRAPRSSRRNYEAEMLSIARGYLSLLDADGVLVRDESGRILLAPGSLSKVETLEQARSKTSGWHFAKEVLTSREQELLYVTEGLLRLLDEQTSGGYLR